MIRGRSTSFQTEKETMDQFEQYRPLMFSIAYRMLGSVTEAEDILPSCLPLSNQSKHSFSSL